jgi:hypothetical protein
LPKANYHSSLFFTLPQLKLFLFGYNILCITLQSTSQKRRRIVASTAPSVNSSLNSGIRLLFGNGSWPDPKKRAIWAFFLSDIRPRLH